MSFRQLFPTKCFSAKWFLMKWILMKWFFDEMYCSQANCMSSILTIFLILAYPIPSSHVPAIWCLCMNHIPEHCPYPSTLTLIFWYLNNYPHLQLSYIICNPHCSCISAAFSMSARDLLLYCLHLLNCCLIIVIYAHGPIVALAIIIASLLQGNSSLDSFS